MDIKEIDERLKNYYPSQHIDDGFYDNAPLLQARIDLSDLMDMVKSLQAERDKYKEAIEEIALICMKPLDHTETGAARRLAIQEIIIRCNTQSALKEE